MSFGNRPARSYNIGVPILFLHFLTNVIAHHNLQIAAPPWSVAAQAETGVSIVIGGLVLLLIVVVVVYWRLSRKPRGAAPALESTPGPEAAPIVVSPPTLPGIISLDFSAESGQRLSFTLDTPTSTIGRAPDNDIVLAAPMLNADTASLHHARLRRDQDDYILRDLGSKNGLLVNGRQTIENLLQDGDRLQFGEVEAIFHRPAGGTA